MKTDPLIPSPSWIVGNIFFTETLFKRESDRAAYAPIIPINTLPNKYQIYLGINIFLPVITEFTNKVTSKKTNMLKKTSATLPRVVLYLNFNPSLMKYLA